MAEELEKLQNKSKRNARLATSFLLGAMFVMALWGWTPLKAQIPALYILIAFLMCMILSIAFAGITTYQGIKTKHMKARLEDK